MAQLLVVDDDQDFAKFLVEVLESTYQHKVECVHDGSEALKRLASEPLPDLIVSDVMMPEVGGFELLSRMRDLRIDVPVLFTSTLGHDSENRILGLRLGAVDFLAKPVVPEELILKVGNLCLRAKAHKTLPPEPPEPSDADAMEKVEPSALRKADISGRLDRIGLAALFSLCESQRSSGVMNVRRGDEVLWLSVRDGRPIRASISNKPDMNPFDCLLQALSWREGEFDYQDIEVGGDDEMDCSFMHALLEHARLEDEGGLCA